MDEMISSITLVDIVLDTNSKLIIVIKPLQLLLIYF